MRSAAVGVWLRRGSRHEREQDCGIAHFIEHMLFKGTPSIPAGELELRQGDFGSALVRAVRPVHWC